MASKDQILDILSGETGPMNRTVLGKRLGLPTSSFQNQLDRMEKQGLIEKNEQNEYTITEGGRQFALAAPPPGPPDEELGQTDESLKTTEYQQFVEMGRTTGVVPLALIEQTTTHVWRGGDFRDLTWVWKGLTEMGIRPDLAQRWWHSWRSFLHQAVPAEIASEVGVARTSTEKEAGKGEAVGKGKRDYILSPTDLPICVGEGVGDLDYEDAVRLSAVRAAAQARGGVQAGPPGQPTTPGSMADEMTKVFNAVKEFLGPQSKGKSYLVKPGEEGYLVEEIEEGKPTVIATPGSNTNPGTSFLVDAEGGVTEVPAGKPVVIKQSTPTTPPQPGKTFIVRQTPEGIVTEEYEAGKPIIINAPPSSSNLPGMVPFPVFGEDGKPVYDSEGKPVYANIEPMMKWMAFQSEQRRADERHGVLMGIGQAVRENFGDGITAIKAAASEMTGSRKEAPKQQEQPQVYECGECHTQFAIPDVPFETVKCPNPECGRVYTKEEVLSS